MLVPELVRGSWAGVAVGLGLGLLDFGGRRLVPNGGGRDGHWSSEQTNPGLTEGAMGGSVQTSEVTESLGGADCGRSSGGGGGGVWWAGSPVGHVVRLTGDEMGEEGKGV